MSERLMYSSSEVAVTPQETLEALVTPEIEVPSNDDPLKTDTQITTYVEKTTEVRKKGKLVYIDMPVRSLGIRTADTVGALVAGGILLVSSAVGVSLAKETAVGIKNNTLPIPEATRNIAAGTTALLVAGLSGLLAKGMFKEAAGEQINPFRELKKMDE